MAKLYTDVNNVFYHTNVMTSLAWMAEIEGKKFLIVDGRYTTAAKAAINKESTLVTYTKNQDIYDLFKKNGVTEVAIEDSTSYADFKNYEKGLKESGIKATSFSSVGSRNIKTKEQVDKIEAACKVGSEVFEYLTTVIKPGMKEMDVSALMVKKALELGAKKMSFDQIVAAGTNSAIPHHRPGDKVIQKNDHIKLDFGVEVDNYCSDMTRMVFLGEVDPKMKEIFDIVLKAQCAAVEAAKPGMTCKEVDAVARNIISEAGYGDKFNHGLGHGIGIEIHETPWVRKEFDTVLKEGMTVTIEPGIYLPELGGVRIEDTIVITKDGSRRLTHTPKELLVIKG